MKVLKISTSSGRSLLVRLITNQSLQASCILFIILNVAFLPALWGDKTLMTSAREVHSVINIGAYGDPHPPSLLRSLDLGASGWQFEPGIMFNSDQILKERHLPLWNPYIGYGAPWAANMMSQPYFPLSFLLSLYPTPDTIDWFLVLRLLIAGFFSYLYLRLFIQHAAAFTGAIACMLTGYFILYLNIDHLSTEVLLPLIFYAMEKMLRETTLKSNLIGTIAIFLTLVAGMPESTFLILIFGSTYFIFRLLVDHSLRKRFRTHILNLTLANIFGFGLAGLLLLPFIEFLSVAIDSHRPSITGVTGGLISVDLNRSFLFYLIPLVSGPPYNNIFSNFTGSTGILGYFGIAPFFLAIAASLSLFRRGSTHRFTIEDHLVIFFSISTFIFFLKHYGHFSVNWIGSLPLFNLILYPKYIQPLIGFSIAMLCGFGAAHTFSGKSNRIRILAASLIVLGLIAFLASRFWNSLQAIEKYDFFFYNNLLAGLALLLFFAVVLMFFVIREQAHRRSNSLVNRHGRVILVIFTVVMVTFELLLNYIYPMYYRFNQLTPQRFNPYEGAPYVRFLQEKSHDHYRVFGREGFLYPNWASAFRLYDVRYIHGMNYEKFLSFIQAFLAPPNLGLHGDLADRFTGDGYWYNFLSVKEERFLQLSAIRFLISENKNRSFYITKILQQNASRIVAEQQPILRTLFDIDGVERDIFFQHAPSSRIPLAVRVRSETPIFTFYPALSPDVFDLSGDGVEFVIELQNKKGEIHKLYQRYLDPKQNPYDRRWYHERIDLSSYIDQDVTLLFSTLSGPKGDNAWDYAGWGELEFVSSNNSSHAAVAAKKFEQIYDGEVKILQYMNPLPRAAVFQNVLIADNPEDALARLQDPRLDIFQKAVVTTQNLNPQMIQNLRALSGSSADRVEAAQIVHYDSQRVAIAADLKRPGLLVLGDSNYPGWKAYVNGIKTPIVEANYLFRGVILPAGTHQVEFRYQPKSFSYGMLVSLLAAVGLSIWCFYIKRNSTT